MSNNEFLTDDYVADLLSKEATDCSLKYSAMGLEAFNTKTKPVNIPKPNTRFLRHIIKDTDAHNKALLAKEAADSKARLKVLEHAEELKRQKMNPNAKDIRRRQLGDIQSILGGKPRRCVSDGNHAADGLERRSDRGRGSRKPPRRERESSLDRRAGRRNHGRLSRSPYDDKKSSHSSYRDESRRSRRRDHSNSPGEESRRHHDRSRRDRSRSRRSRNRSRSPREQRSKHRHRSPLAAERTFTKAILSREDDDGSDCLDDLIGPALPPRYRGRGKIVGSSGMDRRFSESYDPKTDVLMEDDADTNWDDAAEAYRDRQKLRQNQEARMRAAGFADHQIQKVTAYSEKEKMGEDMVWAKAGEKREWDRGKKDEDDVLRGLLSEEQ